MKRVIVRVYFVKHHTKGEVQDNIIVRMYVNNFLKYYFFSEGIPCMKGRMKRDQVVMSSLLKVVTFEVR